MQNIHEKHLLNQDIDMIKKINFYVYYKFYIIF